MIRLYFSGSAYFTTSRKPHLDSASSIFRVSSTDLVFWVGIIIRKVCTLMQAEGGDCLFLLLGMENYARNLRNASLIWQEHRFPASKMGILTFSSQKGCCNVVIMHLPMGSSPSCKFLKERLTTNAHNIMVF